MRTVDFLPAEAFANHLERRRTPRRLLVVAVFTLICTGATVGLGAAVRGRELAAAEALRPDPSAIAAKGDLQRIFGEMNLYARRLDLLTHHLRKPTVGDFLAGLADAAGPRTTIEKVSWRALMDRKGRGGAPLPDQLTLTVTGVVHGDQALLGIPEALKELSGFDRASFGRTEVVPDSVDATRVEILLEELPAKETGKGGTRP